MKRQETIRLSGLQIGYRVRNEEHVVAERLDASISNGELTCLLGRNGAGKSTLLRTLRPSSRRWAVRSGCSDGR